MRTQKQIGALDRVASVGAALLLGACGGSRTGLAAEGTGGSAGDVFDAGPGCIQVILDTKVVPSDVFIMQDKSGSMQCPVADDACTNPGPTPMPPTRWDAMTAAITRFVNSPEPARAGIAVGLGFFGLKDGSTPCTRAAYATPAVPLAPLPGNAKATVDAIETTQPSGGTPTAPAIEGAIEYARTYSMLNGSTRTTAVLLVTDGQPTGCGQTGVGLAVEAARLGFAGTPSIKTFVVGMGNTAALDQVALAGTGGTTHYIPAVGDVAGALVGALDTITTTCVYVMPAVAVGRDPMEITLSVKVGESARPVGRVDDAAACATGQGWYYDALDMPRQISLCPLTCDTVKATAGSAVQIVHGCQ